jgi:hypothetical protein
MVISGDSTHRTIPPKNCACLMLPALGWGSSSRAFPHPRRFRFPAVADCMKSNAT